MNTYKDFINNIPVSLIYKFLAFKWKYSAIIREDYIQVKVKTYEKIIQFSDIIELPEIKNGFLWDRIEFKTKEKVVLSISGVPKKESANSLSILTRQIGQYCLNQIRPFYEQMLVSTEKYESIFEKGYGRHSSVERWKKESIKITEKLNNQFALTFMSDQEKESVSKFLSLFSNSHSIRENKNKKWVREELIKYQDFFDNVENNPLTESQRLACVINEDNNLVLAGAGSGKTSVIIAKAGYLIHSGLAKPYEILILAYGRKASKETDERIKEKLPGIDGVSTSTFHKLGLDIIGHATGIKPRVSKFQENTAEFYKLINRIITNLTKLDNSYNQRLVDYLVTHLIPYKDEFDYKQQGDYFSDLKEFNVESIKSKIEWSKNKNSKKSLKREQLKSFEEVVIADFLFINRIDYIYEHPYEIMTATADKTQYCPDFFLPEYGIYIEHFGINRRGKTAPFVNNSEYLEGMAWKRSLHRQHGTILVETFSYEMKNGTLTDDLYSKLERHGVVFNPLNFEELMVLLADIDEEQKVTQFTKLVITFIDLYKQSGNSFDEIRNKASKHKDKARCHAFLDVFEPIYNNYNEELKNSGEVDFSDMIRKAENLVNNRKYSPRFKYVLVDEFQDISAIRANLVKSVVNQGDDTSLSCVGDDWQSIYRFSGSDIKYTSNFENYFGHSAKVLLDKTFRFNNKINDFATTFVTQNPLQLKKNVKSHVSVDVNSITLVEYYKDVGLAIQKCVDDIVNKRKEPASVYILGRYKFTKPDVLAKIARQYPAYQFLFDTIHGSKGKEADFVIVLDVNDARFGFPSKIVDEPLFDLVLPDTEIYEHAEERRLFYVAITRSKHHSYVLYDYEKPSAFIKEIGEHEGLKYHFNKISTEGVESAPPEYGKCSVCGTGKITLRVMPDGRFFFGCSHYPYCSFSPRVCNSCNKFPMLRDGEIYRCQNPECGSTLRACKLCTDGVMIERTGKYGRFFGCSNYAKTRCAYKEKITG